MESFNKWGCDMILCLMSNSLMPRYSDTLSALFNSTIHRMGLLTSPEVDDTPMLSITLDHTDLLSHHENPSMLYDGTCKQGMRRWPWMMLMILFFSIFTLLTSETRCTFYIKFCVLMWRPQFTSTNICCLVMQALIGRNWYSCSYVWCWGSSTIEGLS